MAKVAHKVALPDAGNLPDGQVAKEVQPFKTRETPILDDLDIDQSQQGLSVREYRRDLNGTQAATRVGYSVDTAASQASDLLQALGLTDRHAGSG